MAQMATAIGMKDRAKYYAGLFDKLRKRFVELLVELRLSEQDDLEQLGLRRLQIREHPDLLQELAIGRRDDTHVHGDVVASTDPAAPDTTVAATA